MLEKKQFLYLNNYYLKVLYFIRKKKKKKVVKIKVKSENKSLPLLDALIRSKINIILRAF